MISIHKILKSNPVTHLCSQMADTCAVRIDFIESRVKGPDNSGKCATDKIDFM